MMKDASKILNLAAVDIADLNPGTDAKVIMAYVTQQGKLRIRVYTVSPTEPTEQVRREPGRKPAGGAEATTTSPDASPAQSHDV